MSLACVWNETARRNCQVIWSSNAPNDQVSASGINYKIIGTETVLRRGLRNLLLIFPVWFLIRFYGNLVPFHVEQIRVGLTYFDSEWLRKESSKRELRVNECLSPTFWPFSIKRWRRVFNKKRTDKMWRELEIEKVPPFRSPFFGGSSCSWVTKLVDLLVS